MSARFFRSCVLVALGTAVAFTAGCSSDSGSVTDSELGSIGLALGVAPGITLNSVSYTIAGPGGFTRVGSIDTTKSTAISALIGGIPAANGYSIVLDATMASAGAHCTGSASFDVTGSSTTAVSVHLACTEPSHMGSVFVNGTINMCPVVDGVSALPAAGLVGSSLALLATAHDSDAGPVALTYHWTTTGGTLSAADVQNPSLTCTTVGVITVSLMVSDGDCSDTLVTTIACTQGGAGGTGGSSSGTGGSSSGTGGSSSGTGGSSSGTGGSSSGSGGNAGGESSTGGSTATTGTLAAVDLSRYTRIGRYALPEPTRAAAPNSTSLLAQEASSVTYNWDTDSLFVVGDGGTSVVQLSKTGVLIDSMTLATGSSPQNTEFYDTEGISYVGNGQFVLIEERVRQANLFTYVAGSTLTRAQAQTVKLGTTIGNIGLEGVTFDPATGHFIFVKEKEPKSIFETGIDFAAGTATNGSPTADAATDLFDPARVDTLDFSDVFALSNLPSLAGDPSFGQLLIISQESGQIVQVDRSGNVKHTLTLVADPSDTISIPDMTMEGVTMDRDGHLYVVNENGGGDSSHPQLWVYAPSQAANLAPAGLALVGAVTSIPENTNTGAPLKLADIAVTDDGLGDNLFSLSGTDASLFEIHGTALFLKAGTGLSAATHPSYSVVVGVDDVSVGGSPDASAPYALAITASPSGVTHLAITEVAPWSSGNSPLASDWFEVTNFGSSPVSLVGWTMDDNSNSFSVSVPLSGIATINPGESVIFIETASSTDLTAKAQAFINLWYGGSVPTGLQIGAYYGSGIGLSTGGDAINLFDSAGTLRAAVSFGTSPSGSPLATFDNSIGLNNVAVSNLSAVGLFGAFVALQDASEIGSPGTVAAGSTPIVGINAPDAQASERGADPAVFRFTRSGSTTSALTVVYSIVTGAGQATPDDYTPALSGSVVIPAGAAFVDVAITPVDDALVEGTEVLALTLSDTGNYDVGVNATATVSLEDNDVVQNVGGLVISEVAPWASGSSSLGADWFEVTNTSNQAISLTGWKMDDNSHSFANAVALNGISSIAPGEAVIFIETANLTTAAAAFRSLWFGASLLGPQIGSYSGSGVGLGTGGDEVNLFDAAGKWVAGVGFGASPASAPYATFDNHAGVNGTAAPLPLVSTLSSAGTNGAFVAPGNSREIGSPGA